MPVVLLVLWMQVNWVFVPAKMRAFLSSPRWQTPLMRWTRWTIYQPKKKKKMHNDTDDCELWASENNEAATRFIVDRNKICWNKMNFYWIKWRNAFRMIYAAVAVNLAELWDSVIAFRSLWIAAAGTRNGVGWNAIGLRWHFMRLMRCIRWHSNLQIDQVNSNCN